MTRLQALRSTFGSIVLRSRALASAGLRRGAHGLAAASSTLVGDVHWQPPAWGRWTTARAAGGWRHLRTHPAQAAGLVTGIAAAAAGAYWYSHRPRPHYVTYAIEAPGLTAYSDTGISSVK